MGFRTVLPARRGFLSETLEARTLLHAALDVSVNFGPLGSETPAGMVGDSGSVFADRGNGYSYGWNADNSASTRERNSALSLDQRYDTLIHLQKGGEFSWEMSLENGDYKVRVVAGDAGYTDSVYKINVEGVLTVDGTPTSSNRWVEGTQVVTVTDGKLTISNAAGSFNNRICFVEIQSDENLPAVSIAASGDATESGNSGGFTISRTGSTHDPLTINYMIGGSAEEGTDYESLGGSVIIPAGQNSVEVSIDPIDDLLAEESESVTLTVAPGDTYEISESGATLNILDDDSPSGSGAINYRINFQTSDSPVPSYYKADTGAKYGARANGLTYGWNADNSTNARQRNGSEDQRYLSFNHMQKDGSFKWEIAVPNGTYTVRVVAGDSGFYNSNYRILAEGLFVVSGKPTSSSRFIDGTRTVTVKDGRLTLSNASDASNNKIAFVEIRAGSAPIPVVSISATDKTCAEEGNNPGYFTVTRTGDTSASLTVDYSLGGTATNGVDYNELFSTVTIPAGQSSAQIKIGPKDDSTAEGSESVIVSLSPSSSYSTNLSSSSSLNIADNDTNVSQGTLKWSSKATGFARAEALRAMIGGKLYVLGGYINGKYLSAPRMDVYDPATNKWTQLGDMPQGLTHAGCAYDDRYIYVAGGYTVNSAGTKQVFAINNVRRYDTVNKSWTSLPNLPSARGGGSMVLVDNELIFMGGSDINRQDKSDVWELHLDDLDDGWTSIAALPQARNHFAAVSYNGDVYVLGGQTGQDAGSVFKRDVWRLNRSEHGGGQNYVWETRASLINQARSHIAYAAFVHNGKIIIAGGETDSGTPNKPKLLNNVEQYDPSTNKWSSLTPLPATRTSGVAASFGNTIIYATGSKGTFTGDTWLGTFV
jgi:N-acetylneuraminic acid mutarotase